MLSLNEIDCKVFRIRKDLWPKLLGKVTPRHCGLCELLNSCVEMNERLICPWLNAQKQFQLPKSML